MGPTFVGADNDVLDGKEVSGVYKRVIAFCIITLMVVSGCRQNIPIESNSNKTQPETYMDETESCAGPAETSSEAIQETINGRCLSDDELEYYSANFNQLETWYSQALTSLYESTKDIDLKELFYNGIPGVDNTLNPEEKEYLQPHFDKYSCVLEIFRLPEEQMNVILEEYFDITLEETSLNGLHDQLYLEDQKCYYLYHSDANGCRVKPHAGNMLEGGDIELYYYSDSFSLEVKEYVVTLRQNDGRLQIVSNLPVEQ